MNDSQRILNMLKSGPVTSEQVWLETGIQRCGARIWDLRKYHNIKSTPCMVNTVRGARSRIAVYSLEAA